MLIRHPQEMTSKRLTEVLRRAGGVQKGEVVSIEVVEHTYEKGYVSHVARLQATYAPDAVGVCPRRLFLKMTKPDLYPEILEVGRREVAFYQAMQQVSAEMPIPTCYEAVFDPERGLAHLLLEDLSESHFQQTLPLPPSNRHCAMIVEGLARMHRYWWERKSLDRDLGEVVSEEKLVKQQQRLEESLPDFLVFMGEALLPTQRRVYEKIAGSSFLDRYQERLMNRRRITVVHGDAHPGNIMLPRDPSLNQIALVDWQLWEIGVGTNDLAFLMARRWWPERRHHLEKQLLHRYHEVLCEDGLLDYSWDACWRDYRESVILMTLIPIGQFRRNQPLQVIWFGLQNSLEAFMDLDCESLL